MEAMRSSSIPIISRIQHDFHTRMIEVPPSASMLEVIQLCLEPAVGYQLAPPPEGVRLRVRPTTDADNAPPWDDDLTVEEVGMQKFEQIDVYYYDYVGS